MSPHTLIIGAATLAAVVSLSAPRGACGADPDREGSETLPAVVISTTALPGAALDIDKVPGNVQSLTAADLVQEGTVSLTGALDRRLGSVNIDDALADPFQPDVVYRGFEASPVLGTPEGLAVYQNGVRINEAFGDAVNWDLIPDLAIERLDLVSANPVYGLNALGAAVAITLKNGFSYEGSEGTLSGGSFNRRDASAQVGANDGRLGIYAAANLLDQDGWREFARDSLRQFYLDLSAHGDAGTLDLAYSRASNRLYGQGAAPVQELAVSRWLVFTGPQDNFNRVDFLTLTGALQLTRTASLQSVLYYRHYGQSVDNGNKTDFTTCTAPGSTALLCQADGLTPLADTAGSAIPDLSSGGSVPIGENDYELIHTVGTGGSLQLTDSHAIADHDNRFAAGVSVDSSRVQFDSGAQVGVISPALLVASTGLFVDTPQSSAFSATPVGLKDDNRYYGFYATDTLDVTPALAASVSVRYNVAVIDLKDERGTSLNGHNRYAHLNPALGATYKISPTMTAYAGYSLNNRAPTASEIECSDPLKPCILPSDLAGDPPNLRQVIARTFEAGLRGKLATDVAGGSLSWDVNLFRTDLHDDIYGVATSVSSGFFENIGATRRQGLESALRWRGAGWSAYASYSLVDATFRSALLVSSPSNPFQDANGDIQVLPGDRLPGVPRHRLKLGVDRELAPGWLVGGTLAVVSPQYYHGDESNQTSPLGGYHLVSLHSSLELGTRLELFLSLQNVLNAHYATYGILADPTGVSAPGVPADGSLVDTRFQSPAAPFAAFAGARLHL